MISLLVVLAVIGVVAYVLVTFVPMPAPIRTVIIVVACLIAVLIAWRAFGSPGSDIGVPQVR